MCAGAGAVSAGAGAARSAGPDEEQGRVRQRAERVPGGGGHPLPGGHHGRQSHAHGGGHGGARRQVQGGGGLLLPVQEQQRKQVNTLELQMVPVLYQTESELSLWNREMMFSLLCIHYNARDDDLAWQGLAWEIS